MKNAILLFFMFCIAQSIFGQAQITNGLVAYYPLNNNANEASGNCSSGANNGALPSNDVCNHPNSAMSFNGTTNYIEAAHCSALQVSNGLSVCAWVKPKAFNYNSGCKASFIVSKGRDFQAGHFDLYFQDTSGCFSSPSGVMNFIFAVYATDSQSYGVGVTDYGNYALDNWYFLTGTFNGNSLKLYIDGVLKNTVPCPTFNIPINNKNLYIGKMADPSAGIDLYHTNGDTDEIRIYNRALTPSEIQILYNQNCWATEIETPINEHFTLFPNPAQGKFSLQLSEGENAQVEMFDMQGKSVLSQKVSEKESDFEVSSFAKGLYVLRVTNDKGVFTKKMLLE